jgi:hypothetical protein
MNMLPSTWKQPSLTQWLVGALLVGGAADTTGSDEVLSMDQLQVSMFVVLAANLVLQWICIRGVFILTSNVSHSTACHITNFSIPSNFIANNRCDINLNMHVNNNNAQVCILGHLHLILQQPIY